MSPEILNHRFTVGGDGGVGGGEHSGVGAVGLPRGIMNTGDAEFDDVHVVYYPGLDYFISLMGSKFYNGIVGDKQLGDTQAIPTVPILDRL